MNNSKEKRFALPDDINLGYTSSPGEVIQDELVVRGWTQEKLANIMNCSIQTINEIINAEKEITTEIAVELGVAFDTSADFWLNLEKDYHLWLEKRGK